MKGKDKFIDYEKGGIAPFYHGQIIWKQPELDDGSVDASGWMCSADDL